MVLTLRLIHIGLGVFWAGSLMFLAFYLGPAVGRAGPEGGRVMQELQKARLMQVMPLVALFTILSGAWLMWIVSGGFDGTFFRSRYGISLTIGAVASIVAYAIGFTVMRPSQNRIGALGQRMATAAPEEKPAIGEEMAMLRGRVARTSKYIAWLLIVAVLTMAAAGYL